MARDSTRTGKTETLTIRLDPKTRFILEYMSRLKGQTITTVVERAIVKAADQETIDDPSNPFPDGWQSFWDVSEGVRNLKLSGRSEFFPTYEEEKRLAFCREHWPFFWSNSQRKQFLNYYVDVLWPRIDEFVCIHDDQKTNDYFAAGKAMQEALRKAQLKVPAWPIPSQPSVTPDQKSATVKPSVTRSLDDDIPF